MTIMFSVMIIMNVLSRNPAVTTFQTIAIPANVTAMPMKGRAPKNLMYDFLLLRVWIENCESLVENSGTEVSGDAPQSLYP